MIMSLGSVTTLAVAIGICSCIVFAQGDMVEASLHEYIFKNYNKHVFPGASGEVVNVSLTCFVNLFLGLDDKKQMLKSDMYVQATWLDGGLSWNETDFPGIKDTAAPVGYVWTPDIAIRNAMTSKRRLVSDDQIVIVRSNGTVIWVSDYIGETHCHLDMTTFPFDSQTCYIFLEPWLHLGNHVRIVEAGLGLNPSSFANGQWELMSSSCSLYSDVRQTNVVNITMNLRRRKQYYLFSIVLPTVVASCLNPVVFLLPADSGEKVGLATTLLLFYSVMLNHIFDSIPSNSYTMPIFGVFIGAQMVLAALSLVCTVLLQKARHRGMMKTATTEGSRDDHKLETKCKHVEIILFSVFGVTGLFLCGTILILMHQ